jgi:hypothetical protein
LARRLTADGIADNLRMTFPFTVTVNRVPSFEHCQFTRRVEMPKLVLPGRALS